jgi:hypothetical protein
LGEVDGQLSDDRQSISRFQISTGNPELHLFDNLPVKRNPAFGVN